MSDPRYRPRDYCAEPLGFGKVSNITWNSVPSGKRAAAHAAAMLQHHYAVAIRRQITAQRSNLKTYASAAGTSYDRLSKMLRGEAIMRLEDIAMADLLIGPITELRLPAVGDSGATDVLQRDRQYSDMVRTWRNPARAVGNRRAES